MRIVNLSADRSFVVRAAQSKAGSEYAPSMNVCYCWRSAQQRPTVARFGEIEPIELSLKPNASERMALDCLSK